MAFNDKDGTGYVSFKDTVVPTAGKTGTMKCSKTESQVNSTYIGYAPIDDPKLAFSIVYTKSACTTTMVNRWRLR